MAKIFKEPINYIQRVLMRSISRMNSSNWAEEDMPSLTPFEVGDVVTQYVFDTSKEAELGAYLTELFTTNPDKDQATLISSLEEGGGVNTKLLSAVNFKAGDSEGPYALAIVDDREGGGFVWVYSTDAFEGEGVVKGFQNLTDGKYVAKKQYAITELGDSNIPGAFAPINGVIVGK